MLNRGLYAAAGSGSPCVENLVRCCTYSRRDTVKPRLRGVDNVRKYVWICRTREVNPDETGKRYDVVLNSGNRCLHVNSRGQERSCLSEPLYAERKLF